MINAGLFKADAILQGSRTKGNSSLEVNCWDELLDVRQILVYTFQKRF
jgi:hypothetical protein